MHALLNRFLFFFFLLISIFSPAASLAQCERFADGLDRDSGGNGQGSRRAGQGIGDLRDGRTVSAGGGTRYIDK